MMSLMMLAASSASVPPLMAAVVEVQVLPAYKQNLGTGDYLVMATDGLWDVVTNEEVGGGSLYDYS